MQKLISKYGLAAHLGIITAAPLVLFPLCSAAAIGVAMLYLALVGAIWVIMEPSRIGREMPHNARERVIRTIVRDPLFYALLLLAGFAAVRALNQGVGMSYDLELQSWAFRDAPSPFLPGSVKGAAFLPFCVSVAMVPVVMGVRHALGKAARCAFAVTVAVVAGTGGIVFALMALNGSREILKLAECAYNDPYFAGPAFGIALLLGFSGMFAANEKHWLRVEFLLVPGLIGTAAGLVMFAPALDVLVFAGTLFVLVIAGFALQHKAFEGAGSFRAAVSVITVLVVVGFVVVLSPAGGGVNRRVQEVQMWQLFPEAFFQVRAALSGIALKVFANNPWLGSGLGSFPVDIRFLASAAEHKLIFHGQTAALQGWWQLVAERGVIGSVLLSLVWGMIGWTYVSRLIGAFSAENSRFELRAVNLIFPVVSLALAAITFFECSLYRCEVMLLAVAALALSASSAPSRKKSAKES